MRWRRSNASPIRSLTSRRCQERKVPSATTPGARFAVAASGRTARFPGVFCFAGGLPAAPPARVTPATERTARTGDPSTSEKRFRSDAVRGRPRRRIASEGPRRFTPHVAPRGRPALGKRAQRAAGERNSGVSWAPGMRRVALLVVILTACASAPLRAAFLARSSIGKLLDLLEPAAAAGGRAVGNSSSSARWRAS